jgi:hypothetical protein
VASDDSFRRAPNEVDVQEAIRHCNVRVDGQNQKSDIPWILNEEVKNERWTIKTGRTGAALLAIPQQALEAGTKREAIVSYKKLNKVAFVRKICWTLVEETNENLTQIICQSPPEHPRSRPIPQSHRR